MDTPPPGMNLTIKIGGAQAANTKLVFLGEHGSDAGESRMWGDLYVSARKALVKITDVLCSIPVRLTVDDVINMPDFHGTIAVNASQIHKRIGGASTQPATSIVAAATTTISALNVNKSPQGDAEADMDQAPWIQGQELSPNNDCCRWSIPVWS